MARRSRAALICDSPQPALLKKAECLPLNAICADSCSFIHPPDVRTYNACGRNATAATTQPHRMPNAAVTTTAARRSASSAALAAVHAYIAKVDGRKVVAAVNMPLLKHSNTSSRCARESPQCRCTALRGSWEVLLFHLILRPELGQCSANNNHGDIASSCSDKHSRHLNRSVSVKAETAPSAARMLTKTANLPTPAPYSHVKGAATSACMTM